MEKVENEAATTEMKRQIAFLKSTQFQVNCATQGLGMHFDGTTQTLNIPSNSTLCACSSFSKQSVGGNTSNTSN